MGTVHSILTGWASHVTVGPIRAWIAETFSSGEMAFPIKTIIADVFTVLSIRSIGAFYLTPVSDPAGIAVCAFPIHVVAGVAIFAGRAHFLALFPEETRVADLVTLGAVPASFTSQTTPCCNCARLLLFTPSASASAALPVEARGAGLPAELASIAWLAGTGAVGLVALAMDTLAVPLAARAPQPLVALAEPAELLAGGVAAGALAVAGTPPPARLADAAPCALLTHRAAAAVARVGTLGAPPARVARALARVLVALPPLAEALVLALDPPAVGVAGALADHVVAAPVRVAGAHFLAVRAEELTRAFGLTIGSKVSMATATFIGSHAHFVLFAGKIPFTNGCNTFIHVLLPSRAAYK